MPKQKKSKKTLENFITGYDSSNLVGALQSLEDSVAWELYKAYCANVQRQYEVAALDISAREEKGASYASGYAKCAEDMTNLFMEGLKKTVLNVNPVIETVRVEE